MILGSDGRPIDGPHAAWMRSAWWLLAETSRYSFDAELRVRALRESLRPYDTHFSGPAHIGDTIRMRLPRRFSEGA